MGSCSATKKNGEPCTLQAGGDGLCWAHSPDNQERRRKGQSKGGRNRPSKELLSIKDRLLRLADDVEAGRVETGVGAVVNQILNSYLRAIQVGLKVREQEELEQRLEELERLLGNSERSGTWG